MNSALMFSKASDEWSTPQDFYDALHAEFDFVVDAAATQDNRKCQDYLGPDHMVPSYRDALSADWSRYGNQARMWCNPPYSKCREFVAKAAAERLRGVLTVMLVPARTDTRWFHDFIWNRTSHDTYWPIQVRFVKGRLKFGEGANSAPFPSLVVVFRP